MKESLSLLDRERRSNALGWFVSCSLMGFLLWIGPDHAVWTQWALLAHAVTGVACLITLSSYLFLHLRRTLGVRRPGVLFSGLVTLPIFFSMMGTGLHLAYFGHLEAQRWISTTHTISSALFLAVAVGHVVLHVLFLPRNRRGADRAGLFPALPEQAGRSTLWTTTGVILFVFAGTALYEGLWPDWSSKAAIEPYEQPYGDHPFRPSQTETSTGSFVEKAQVARSERCAACHPAIAKQWQASAHREAASDLTYVRNIELLAEQKGISATRYCEGCHAPVALLSGELSPGGQHGGVPGTVAHHEGVSCLSCHGIDAAVSLKGVASYRFRPASDYLFASSESPLLGRVHNWLLRSRPEIHRAEMGRDILGDARLCATCHAQFMDKDMNDWGWVKMQDEYSAWLESPFSGHHEDGFANAESTTCVDCHMPRVALDDPSADEEGTVRAHFFPGANTVLPLVRGDTDQLKATRDFLQANRVRISIDPPNREDARQTLQPIEEELRGYSEAPYYYYLGETAELRITVANNGVGHNFPGGTIDLGEAWIEVLATDAEGAEIYASGSVERAGPVDPDAYFYRSLPVDRRGQLVWKHDLFKRVGESFKRVVKAGESDLVDYAFLIPAWAKSPISVSATLRYRKLNDRYARWAMGEQYQPVPIVDMSRDSLVIPLRVRREVE